MAAVKPEDPCFRRHISPPPQIALGSLSERTLFPLSVALFAESWGAGERDAPCTLSHRALSGRGQVRSTHSLPV